MAPFSLEESLQHPLDYRLLQNGPLVRYRSRAFLHNDIAELASLGYMVTHVALDRCPTMEGFHDLLALSLAFPDWYGRNWNALRDLLVNLEPSGARGRVLAFEGCDRFDELETLVGVLADACWSQLLYGERLVCIVQLDESERPLRTPGGDVQFNPREWLHRDREGT